MTAVDAAIPVGLAARTVPIVGPGWSGAARLWDVRTWHRLWRIRETNPSLSRWALALVRHSELTLAGDGDARPAAIDIAARLTTANKFPGESARIIPTPAGVTTPPGVRVIDAAGVRLHMRGLTMRDLEEYQRYRRGRTGDVPALVALAQRSLVDERGGRLFADPRDLLDLWGAPIASAGMLALNVAIGKLEGR